MTEQRQGNGMATASLIMGIISIVTGFFGWLGIICGILAIIFAIVAKNKIKANPAMAHTKGQATGGLITGIIGLIIGVVIIIIAIMFVSAMVGAATEGLNEAAIQDALRNAR